MKEYWEYCNPYNQYCCLMPTASPTAKPLKGTTLTQIALWIAIIVCAIAVIIFSRKTRKQYVKSD